MRKTLSYLLFRLFFCWIFAFLTGGGKGLWAQTTIYSESFSGLGAGLPSGWSQSGPLPGWSHPDSLPASTRPVVSGCDFGGSFLRFPSSLAVPGQVNSLVSPALNLAAYPGASLQLQACLVNPGPASGEGDGIACWVSPDNGQSWNSLGTDSSWYGGWTTVSWSIPTQLLSAQFRFRIDGFGSGALLDVGLDRVRVVNPAPPCLAQPSLLSASIPPIICADDIPDPILFSAPSGGNASYAYVVADALDRILAVEAGPVIDFNLYPPDEYHVYGVSYLGFLQAPVNQLIQFVSASGCAILSQNHLAVHVAGLEVQTTVLSNYNGFGVSGFGQTNGSAGVQISGGSGNFEISWSGNAGANGTIADNLPGGWQMITVVDLLTGCTRTDSFELLSPAPLMVELVPVETFNGAPIRCAGEANGTLEARIEGGVQPYTLMWEQAPGHDSLRLGGLAAGLYSVRVSDVNLTETTDSINLTEPQLLTGEVAQLKHACEGLPDGAILLQSSGGTGTVRWLWDHGPQGPILAGLLPGGYAATATDLNGCSSRVQVSVEQAPRPEVVPLIAQPTCAGNADGSIVLESISGRAPFLHQWQHGPLGDSLGNLAPGNYLVFTTDANGCRDTARAFLQEPTPLSVKVESYPDGGSGTGQAQVEITGGTGPFAINWSNGDTARVSGQLTAGRYEVLVTDARGCEVIAETTVETSDFPDCLAQHLGFSPNGDGMNDTWELPCLANYDALEVQLYNRWGQRLLYDTSYQQPWDGTAQGVPLSVGTYYFVVRVQNQGRWSEYKGTLSLLR